MGPAQLPETVVSLGIQGHTAAQFTHCDLGIFELERCHSLSVGSVGGRGFGKGGKGQQYQEHEGNVAGW